LLNRSPFALCLPSVWFRILLEPVRYASGKQAQTMGGLVDLLELDPQYGTTLHRVQGLDKSSWASLMEQEELPRHTTKQAYVAHVAKRVLVDDYGWQWGVARAGFEYALGSQGLQALLDHRVSAADLQDMVCGAANPHDPASDFDISSLFRVVYSEEVSEQSQLLNAFWQVLSSWSPAQKRLFLKFVTGVDTLPAPQTEPLVIELPFYAANTHQHKQILHMLPQSHTCSNTLELPNYYESFAFLAAQESRAIREPSTIYKKTCDILHQKLLMAVTDTDGYGLDA